MREASAEFTKRAGLIASRDGIPDAGSSDVRLHAPLEGDRYISTNRVMASFRSAKGMPLALLERLWSDDEHTHIVDRTALVIDLGTGKVVDAGLFFQREPGDYTSIVSHLEIEIDRARKDINLAQRKKAEGFEERIAALAARRTSYAELLGRFEHAAETFGVRLSPDLVSNRQLFKIAPKSQIARYAPDSKPG